MFGPFIPQAFLDVILQIVLLLDLEVHLDVVQRIQIEQPVILLLLLLLVENVAELGIVYADVSEL